jgi:glycosyltransferase involved in cell wall biosynthesis
MSSASTEKGDASVLLSVLIPVYNWDVSDLVEKLSREVMGHGLRGQVEIVALDDGSYDLSCREANRRCMNLLALEIGTYYENPENSGRSSARNLLARRARGEYLLFLDCDVLPDSGAFLQAYVEAAREGKYDVVCGGVSYKSRVRRGEEYDFHAYHGTRTEVMGASARNTEPWRLVLTSNVMVRRAAFAETPLSTEFTGYGYEDLEWGIRLAQANRVWHMDNSVSHLGLVTKEDCYKKMRDSIRNYALVAKLHPEYFAKTRIHVFVRALRYVPSTGLAFIDRLLSRMFWKTTHLFALHLIFQLDKAVLMALQTKAQ